MYILPGESQQYQQPDNKSHHEEGISSSLSPLQVVLRYVLYGEITLKWYSNKFYFCVSCRNTGTYTIWTLHLSPEICI